MKKLGGSKSIENKNRPIDYNPIEIKLIDDGFWPVCKLMFKAHEKYLPDLIISTLFSENKKTYAVVAHYSGKKKYVRFYKNYATVEQKINQLLQLRKVYTDFEMDDVKVSVSDFKKSA